VAKFIIITAVEELHRPLVSSAQRKLQHVEVQKQLFLKGEISPPVTR